MLLFWGLQQAQSPSGTWEAEVVSSALSTASAGGEEVPGSVQIRAPTMSNSTEVLCEIL